MNEETGAWYLTPEEAALISNFRRMPQLMRDRVSKVMADLQGVTPQSLGLRSASAKSSEIDRKSAHTALSEVLTKRAEIAATVRNKHYYRDAIKKILNNKPGTMKVVPNYTGDKNGE